MGFNMNAIMDNILDCVMKFGDLDSAHAIRCGWEFSFYLNESGNRVLMIKQLEEILEVDDSGFEF